MGIEAVSKMLRPRTTRTTKLFYARRGDKPFAEAERAWTVESQFSLIENQSYMKGMAENPSLAGPTLDQTPGDQRESTFPPGRSRTPPRRGVKNHSPRLS